jgi:hypothetical protein
MATVEFRYDPKNTAWFTANAAMVLKAGEPAYHDTTGLFKLGDGVTALSALSFLPIVSSSTPTLQQVLTAGNVATTTIETTGFIKTGGTSAQFLKADGTVDSNVYGVGDALTTNPLSQFAATTSSQLAGVISDETGTGALVFGTSPTFTTNITTPQITGVSGNLVFTNAAQSSGAITNFTFTAANHTTQTASANIPTVSFTLGTLQRNTGTVTTQHGFLINSPTYSFVGASTITNAYSLFVNAPTVGTNATITNRYAAGFSGRVGQYGLGNSTYFGDLCGVKDDLASRQNTAFGFSAANKVAGGSLNVAIGATALFSNVSGNNNVAIGGLTLYQATSNSNIAVGGYALYNLTNGQHNVAIGYNTGGGVTIGANNIFIGNSITGLASSLSNNIILATNLGVERFRYNPSQGSPSLFSFSPASTAGNVSGTEINIFRVNAATTTLIAGTLATQRFTYLPSQTLAFAGASTATNVYNLFVEAPIQGTNATITNNYALGLAGSLKINDTFNIVFDTTTGTKIATATTQKLSFWNATPIVQPTTAVAAATFVQNSGGTIHPTSTFDGYTIEQVVRALRTIGLLA